MHSSASPKEPQYHVLPRSIGRIASVTGSKAILLLDAVSENDPRSRADRPEMGTLLAIDTGAATILATVSALSVPLPAHGSEQETADDAEQQGTSRHPDLCSSLALRCSLG